MTKQAATQLLNIETKWSDRGVRLTAILSNGARVAHPGKGFSEVVAICERVGIDVTPYREAQARGYRAAA
jgi:hypothetical protein